MSWKAILILGVSVGLSALVGCSVSPGQPSVPKASLAPGPLEGQAPSVPAIDIVAPYRFVIEHNVVEAWGDEAREVEQVRETILNPSASRQWGVPAYQTFIPVKVYNPHRPLTLRIPLQFVAEETDPGLLSCRSSLTAPAPGGSVECRVDARGRHGTVTVMALPPVSDGTILTELFHGSERVGVFASPLGPYKIQVRASTLTGETDASAEADLTAGRAPVVGGGLRSAGLTLPLALHVGLPPRLAQNGIGYVSAWLASQDPRAFVVLADEEELKLDSLTYDPEQGGLDLRVSSMASAGAPGIPLRARVLRLFHVASTARPPAGAGAVLEPALTLYLE